MTHDQPNPQHEPEDIHFSRVSNTVSTLAACGILVLTVAWTAYAWNFSDQSISGDPADWGAFGDFVGGIANPIFSFMTLILLAMTIIVQARQLTISSKELKLSRQELELSRTELGRSASAQELSEKALKAQAESAKKQPPFQLSAP